MNLNPAVVRPTLFSVITGYGLAFAFANGIDQIRINTFADQIVLDRIGTTL